MTDRAEPVSDSSRTTGLTCLPVSGIGEVLPGDDLAASIAAAADLHDGDLLVLTSKVVSKAEGRLVTGDRQEMLATETDRVVARRGPTSIVRTRHGLVMAAAGIDASNTEPGTLVLLPLDPDVSAREIREQLLSLTGANVAVVVTDTAGRAWRTGQTDIAIGVAGLDPLRDYAGTVDGYGNVLAVTLTAVADEVAGAADLVKGKLGRRPAAVVRGLPHLVLAASDHGPGARCLVRPEEQDMFGYGAREAVLAAVAGVPAGVRGFGAPVDHLELGGVLEDAVAATPQVHSEVSALHDRVEVRLESRDQRVLGRLESTLETVAFAHGWPLDTAGRDGPAGERPGVTLRFHRPTP